MAAGCFRAGGSVTGSKEVQQEAMGASWFAGGGKTGFYRRASLGQTLAYTSDIADYAGDRPLPSFFTDSKQSSGHADSWRTASGKALCGIELWRHVWLSIQCATPQDGSPALAGLSVFCP
jgi:hypothetical protein